MKRFPIIATGLVAILGASLFAAEEIKLEGIKCIMNPKGAAMLEKSVDFKDGKVFFCCGNCPKAFTAKVEAEDALVIAKANKQLVQTEQAVQAKCPFTGGPLKTELDVDGATVQFCCNNCLAKAKKLEGDEQLTKLFGDEAFAAAGFKVPTEEKAE